MSSSASRKSLFDLEAEVLHEIVSYLIPSGLHVHKDYKANAGYPSIMFLDYVPKVGDTKPKVLKSLLDYDWKDIKNLLLTHSIFHEHCNTRFYQTNTFHFHGKPPWLAPGSVKDNLRHMVINMKASTDSGFSDTAFTLEMAAGRYPALSTFTVFFPSRVTSNAHGVSPAQLKIIKHIVRGVLNNGGIYHYLFADESVRTMTFSKENVCPPGMESRGGVAGYCWQTTWNSGHIYKVGVEDWDGQPLKPRVEEEETEDNSAEDSSDEELDVNPFNSKGLENMKLKL